MAIHAFPHAELTVLGKQSRLIILRDEIIEVVVRLQNHVAPAPAITAVRPALGTILLAPESHAAFAAVARTRVDFDFVYEHFRDFPLLPLIMTLMIDRAQIKIKPEIKLEGLVTKKGEAEAPPV